MAYKAITEDDPRKDLAHWKYISKKRGKDGDWIYTYSRKNLGVSDYLNYKKEQNAAKESYKRGNNVSFPSDMTKEEKNIAEYVRKVNYADASKHEKQANKYHNEFKNSTLGQLSSKISKGKDWLEKKFGK